MSKIAFYKYFNKKQKESLANFFNTIAAAWFIVVFATPTIDTHLKNPLTLVGYLVNMILSLALSLLLLNESI